MTMKVEGPRRGAPTASRSRAAQRDPGAGVDFERALRGFLGDGGAARTEASETSPVDAPAATSTLDGLLAIQEAGTEHDAASQQRRQTRLMRHGEDMLERLEEIRLGLLLGAIPKERLMDLARLVRTRREQAPDRQLDALLDEIELRAEVELAKLARANA
ncbi:flagellar assembly protein FliX [Roseospira visakhapatnamensis]|uniref:Class II flagellar assembly regulator n=1 Tax=Roseospira visakhapatnamensis TaxID=390880 RepID=A0A7W6RAA7_9PROT|nr:flagellar assembly protein FliX [Roseospira visakhapatnamensis]MBB4264436.1 hypothetical protein [Roseospira visakhapatnamensis]